MVRRFVPSALTMTALNELEGAGLEVWTLTAGAVANTVKLFPGYSEAHAQRPLAPTKQSVVSCDDINLVKAWVQAVRCSPPLPELTRQYAYLSQRASVTPDDKRCFVAGAPSCGPVLANAAAHLGRARRIHCGLADRVDKLRGALAARRPV